MSRILIFKGLLQSDSKKARKVARVLASKTILKICYKSFFKYLAIKNIADSFRAELKERSKAKSFFGIKISFNSFILVLIREKTLKLALNRIKEFMKV